MQSHLGSEVQRADGLSQEVARLRQSALSFPRDRKVSQPPVNALQAPAPAILKLAPESYNANNLWRSCCLPGRVSLLTCC